MAVTDRIGVDPARLEPLCDKWQVRELTAFGSVLREDFGEDSDIDLLVSFREGARWSLLDMVLMEEEFSAALGRPVDLVSRRAVEDSRNYIRRRSILSSVETVYVAR